MLRLLSLGVCTLLSYSVFATIIVPFQNIGALSEIADDVIIARVSEDLFHESEIMTNYAWQLEVLHSFKNRMDVGDHFNLSAISTKSFELQTMISGDLKLEENKTYLFFLKQKEDGSWTTVTLSYYTFEIMEHQGALFWVPIRPSLDICTHGQESAIFVMPAKKFNDTLTEFLLTNGNSAWNDNEIKASISVFDFHPELKAPPGHCSFLFDGTNCNGTITDGVRWNLSSNESLEVWSDMPEQTETPTSSALISDGITEMASNYSGVNLSDEGIVGVDYVPDCMGGSAASSTSNFFAYCNANLNGLDQILVIYNDPCEQITDLSTCSGTLAIGGLYGSCAINTHDGLSWVSGQRGFVIFNDDMVNGSGNACLSNANFEIVAIHEMTHALGFGHIAGSGTANMNPSCCNAIATLDQQCVDYLYPSVVPVSWLDFKGETNRTFNQLVWQTASEVNNDFFEIEYSSNGQDYDRIGTVGGNGNSDQVSEYSFEDHLNLNSKAYYRIKQVDYDGSFSYSKVIQLRREIKSEDVLVYPNPAKNELFVLADLSTSKIRIFNTVGKEMIAPISLYSNANAAINIEELEIGIYYIEVYSDHGSVIKTFTKN